jgi:hypothetical protein
MTLRYLAMPTAGWTANDDAGVGVDGNRHDARMR